MQTPAHEASKAAPRAPLVLVVDDYSDTRDMYAEYLDYAGYRAQTASDGREAVRRALQAHPSAIVMDLAMPVLDGWEATRILHADPRTCDIPIVVLTGHALNEQKQRARDSGATLVLNKPCPPKELLEVLDAVINGKPLPRPRSCDDES
jgi:two-component system, cell cycle response regulator DivK